LTIQGGEAEHNVCVLKKKTLYTYTPLHPAIRD
jgi:hypothetical protein